MDMNKRTIAGIEFEAVKFTKPCIHYRPRVVSTGYLYQSGIFNGHSRPKLWASIEYMASRIGNERFKKETLEAYMPDPIDEIYPSGQPLGED